MRSDEFKTLLEDTKPIFIVGKIMTPREEFVYFDDLKDKHNESAYDVIPKRNLQEYWDRKNGKIHSVSPEDIISYHLDLLSFIDCLKDRDFYFVIHGRGIGGIVHFSDLKKQHVRILFYILTSALELRMRQFYEEREEFIQKNLSAGRIEDINELIENDKKLNQEMPIINYLLFSDFLSLLEKDKEFLKKKSYTREKFKKEFRSLNELRKWVAHPVREEIRTYKNIKEFLMGGKGKLSRLCKLLEEN